MPYTPEEKKQTLTRLRRIKGQITALEKVLEEGFDCGQILQQLAAARGAVNGLMARVLESYLRNEFPPKDKVSASQQKSIDDAISIVQAYLR